MHKTQAHRNRIHWRLPEAGVLGGAEGGPRYKLPIIK